jgi:hypothetical protein
MVGLSGVDEAASAPRKRCCQIANQKEPCQMAIPVSVRMDLEEINGPIALAAFASPSRDQFALKFGYGCERTADFSPL